MVDLNEDISLSLVFPILNEEQTIPLLRSELSKFDTTFKKKHEIILVNDGSTDHTSRLINDWANQDKKVRIIELPHNIGHQKALLKGIQTSRGDAVITMDADLQDPLSLIPAILEKTNQGFSVVHMQRRSRKGESSMRRAAIWFFYRFARYVFRKKILLDVGDFRLMTRKAVDVYFEKYPNPTVLRREIVNLPIEQAILPYHREPRTMGKSKFTIPKLIQFAGQMLFG